MHGSGVVPGERRGGEHALQERRPLQRTVRILLECILVLYKIIKKQVKYFASVYRATSITD